MKKTAIVTDSNSGITQAQAKKLGLYILPMPFIMNKETYFEDIDLSQETFYEKLAQGANISTSQPAVGDVIELWDKLLREYEEVIHIPMSAGLSASCGTALMVAEEYGGRVHVVNNLRISVTQRQSALDAVYLANAGWSATLIKKKLEQMKLDSSIYIMVDTLKFLKKGGRITPAAAAIGSVLHIKPVLQIQGDRLDSFAKAKGVKQAKKVMIEAIRKDFETRFKNCHDPEHMWLQMAYTYDKNAALEFKKEVETAIPGYKIHMDPLSLSVSCHIGPGALAVGCTKKLDI